MFVNRERLYVHPVDHFQDLGVDGRVIINIDLNKIRLKTVDWIDLTEAIPLCNNSCTIHYTLSAHNNINIVYLSQ